MKTKDYVKDLRGKAADQLKDELVALRKEQFNLRMQNAVGQLGQSSFLRDVRRRIARVKTIVAQQASKG
jgi:large subunit ribosomal protein L29